MTRHLTPNITDIAAEICRRDTETPSQVESNRIGLIYGLLWVDSPGSVRTLKLVWTLLKRFLTNKDKQQGIMLARELIKHMNEVRP